MRRELPERGPDYCLVCGRPQPSGHVVVTNRRHVAMGRVCSTHTLAEVINHPSDRFMIEITTSGDRS